MMVVLQGDTESRYLHKRIITMSRYIAHDELDVK